MQHVLVEPCLRRRRNGGETQYQQHIPVYPMVLVDTLCVVDAAEHVGGVILRDSHDGLQEEEDVGDETQDCVGRFEVGAAVGDFVVFDYDQGSEEGEDGGYVEGGVDVGALFLLLGGVGWLEEEDGLGGEEDAGRVEELLGWFSLALTVKRKRREVGSMGIVPGGLRKA